MSIIYNFQVCEKYHQTRTKALYNTICKEIEKRNEKFYLISGFNKKDDIPVLRLSESDDYHSAIEKTLKCFIYHKNNQTPFDFIFFGDDDTFINLENLEKFVNTIDKDKLAIYGSVHNMWFRQDDKINEIFCTGGPGFIMSRKTFNTVVEAIEKYQIRDLYHSDVSLAFNIHKYNSENSDNIEFVNVSGFEQDHRFIIENKRIKKENYKDIITYHLREWLMYVNDYDDVLEVYNRINKYPKNIDVSDDIKLSSDDENINILYAEYEQLDVTTVLKDSIKNNHLSIKACNEIFSDPKNGVVKTLYVEYYYKKRIYYDEIVEGEMLHIPEKKIDYIISSTYNFYEKTLPTLIPSLLESGINPNNIKIYIGNSPIEYIDSYMNCYVKFVKHNSFDYTSFIEYVDEDWNIDWIFSLHDTCKVTRNFREKVEIFDETYDAICPTMSFVGVCNFGMYNKKILKEKYNEIKGLKNCSKEIAISKEGFLFKNINKINSYPNDNYYNMIYSEPVFDNETYNGITRKVEYFENIGLYKYKANWGVNESINRNVTEL